MLKYLKNRGKLLSFSLQECIIEKSVKSVRCALTVHQHSQTTTATTNNENGPKVTQKDSLYILQKARTFQHICGFIAGSRLLFVVEAIM